MGYLTELDFAKQLAHDAGTIMKKYFRSDAAATKLKHDKTPVTLADTEVNSLVITRVKEAFPNHSVLGEEESLNVRDAAFTWVCDPVDGTQPFSKGLPISTFSLALVNKHGESVLGVVYDPFEDRLYEATRNGGAYLNGEKIVVSTKDTLDIAYVDQELWVNAYEGISFADPRGVLSNAGAKVTTMCSCALMGCMVAQGAYDGLLFGQGKPEDIAALSVIVEEAGGKVTDLLGKKQRYDRKIYGAVVSNGKLHERLVKVTANMNYVSK